MKNPWLDDENEEKKTKEAAKEDDSRFGVDIVDDFFKFLKEKRDIVTKIVVLLVVGFFASTGFYVIEPQEQGIVFRFGKYSRTSKPGLNYKLPYPVESIIKESVTTIRTIKIGTDDTLNKETKEYSQRKRANLVYATAADVKTTDRLEEGLILTGDENIINVQFEIQYKIRDLKDYFFNLKDADLTVYDTGRSVVREVIGTNKLTNILTSGRGKIESQSKELLQATLDQYKSGIDVVLVQMLRADPPANVIDSFRDVQTARVDKESKINQAQKYTNDIIPKARGAAKKMVTDAEAYSIEVINMAHGNAKKFDAIYNQYKDTKYVTKRSIYLDFMKSIFKKADITIVDQNIKTIVINGESGKQTTTNVAIKESSSVAE